MLTASRKFEQPERGIPSFLADPDGFGDTVRETTGSVVKNYTYRADGKVASFQSANIAVNYYYDGLNRLAAKAVSDNGNNYTQSFVHLGREPRVLLGKGGDDSVTTYIDGIGASERLAEVKNGVGKGYITDHLGSVLNSPVAGSAHQYGLFGELSANPGILPTSSPVAYGFTGHIVDLESGLNRTHFRQFDSKVGRWVSQDPIGLEGNDENLYRYVTNNPLLFTDSTGLLRDPSEIMQDALDHPDSSSGTRDRGNAFQHCFASCMMTAENGSATAFALGHAFEGVNNWNGQSSADWAMDVNNNAKGRELAACGPSNLTSFNKETSKQIYNQCASSCKKADLTYMDFK